MNVGEFLREAAARFPDRAAIRWGDLRRNYREMNARCDALAAGLVDGGLREGHRVGVLAWNRPELIESFFAAWKAGGCVVPLNARYRPAEVADQLVDCSASALIVGPEHARYPAALRERVSSLTQIYSIDCSIDGAEPYEGVISLGSELPPARPRIGDDDLAWLFYTSGTTGKSKGAMLTHANLRAMAEGWLVDLTPLGDDDVGLHAAPLSHGAGFHALALTLAGCPQVILEGQSFDSARVFELIEEHRVTNTWLVPTQIRMLLREPSRTRRDLSSLSRIVYGGAPMYVTDLEEGLRELGSVFVQLYGQGETPMTATFLPPEDHALGSPRLASCGRARTGIEVQIRDANGRECSRGEVGEICVRGPTVMQGYWQRPEATKEALRDGWLHTGDLAEMDADGYVYIKDRSKDMIISGGSNVYPREVEEVLLEHGAVAEVCVIGVPDEEWGEAVKAVVVLQPGASARAHDLIQHVGDRLEGFKKPKSVDFVDALPKSAYGKVLKRRLRERYWAGHPSRV